MVESILSLIDCHGLMFKKAAQLLPSRNADYIISGEVLGHDPKVRGMMP